MTLVVPPVPFGVAWVSASLYRTTPHPDPFLSELAEVVEHIGTGVAIDGWVEALDSAWAQLVAGSPGVAAWCLTTGRPRSQRVTPGSV